MIKHKGEYIKIVGPITIANLLKRGPMKLILVLQNTQMFFIADSKFL